MLDLIVVGTGIMGSSAARHAALAGASVLGVGAAEPSSPEEHHSLFGAWHDVSRLNWRLHDHSDDTLITERSIEAIKHFESQGSQQILHEVGFLNLTADGFDEGMHAAAQGGSQSVEVETLGSETLQKRFPYLDIPPTVKAYSEGSPSGHINVRRLVETQRAAAVQAGAEMISGEVVGVRTSKSGSTVMTRDGRAHKAKRVLLATGAFSNRTAFLPRPLALRLKTETVLMVELDPTEVYQLADMPTIHYQVDSPLISSIYMVPPLEHSNGRTMLKFGANTKIDTHITEPNQISQWYRTGPSDRAIADLSTEWTRLFPTIRPKDFHTTRCVIAFTPHGHPFVDELVAGSLFVATGGNGHSAKWCDGLGELAAGLALKGDWADTTVDPRRFRAQFADEAQTWTGRPLMSAGTQQ